MGENKEKNRNENENEAKLYKANSVNKKNSKKTRKIENISNKTVSKEKQYDKKSFAQILEIATRGLNYISETDAEIFPFIGGKSATVDSNSLLVQINAKLNTPVEERDFEGFFSHIITIQDWFYEDRIVMAKNFDNLKGLLEENLSDLKVFKVGIINLDVYVVGHDTDNNLIGIKTKAVET